MQIQLSTHELLIYYGETFDDYMTAVINGIADYEIDFTLCWYDNYCVITLDEITRKDWEGVLTEVFENICE